MVYLKCILRKSKWKDSSSYNIFCFIRFILVITDCTDNSINITVNPQPAILSYPVTIKFYANAINLNVTWENLYLYIILRNSTRTRMHGDNDGYYYLEILNITSSDATMYRAITNNGHYCDITLLVKSKLSCLIETLLYVCYFYFQKSFLR